MKIFIVLIVFIVSACSFRTEDESFKKDIEEIKETSRRIRKQIDVMNCHTGLIIAINKWNKYLYKKVTKEEFESAWSECEKLSVDDETK